MLNDCDIISLSGDVDLARVDELDAAVEGFRLSAALNAVVDLSDVTFFGGEAVAFVFRLCQLARPRGGTVTLINASVIAAEVVDVWGLHDVVQERLFSAAQGPAIRVGIPAQRPASQGASTSAPQRV